MDWLTETKIPVGKTAKRLFDWLQETGEPFFDWLSWLMELLIDGILWVLQTPHPLLVTAVFVAITWLLQRNWKTCALVLFGFLFILNQGYWEETTESLTLVLSACVVCMAVGTPIGIAAAHRPRLFRAMRPVLDLMQTLPTFVYLIPAIVFFGIGMVPGLIATVIFVLPAPIRLTHLGVSSTPPALLEAAQAFGATRAALCAAADHDRPESNHHAVIVDGCHRSIGRGRWSGCARRAGIESGEYCPWL